MTHTVYVYIGRFSPFHNGHAQTIKYAQAKGDSVLVLVGSVDQARSLKNPWTYKEREQMIIQFVQTSTLSSTPVTVAPLRDFPYNDQLWIAEVHMQIAQYAQAREIDDLRVVIVGANRDESTYYLNRFPEYDVDLTTAEDICVSDKLSATAIRQLYFDRQRTTNLDAIQYDVPTTTFVMLRTFIYTSYYDDLCDEYAFNANYRKPWQPRPATKTDPGLPYNVIFHTVDAVVVQTGYVLLVKRKHRPGQGLWALPGGFLNVNERLFDGAIRELKEETRIKVPEAVLRGSMVYNDTFDLPDRSSRGRTITTAFMFNLPDYAVNGTIKLPKIKGSDDAASAMWVPISEIQQSPDMFFEDHWFIIEYMLNKL